MPANTALNTRVNYTPPFGKNVFNQILWADLPLNLDISPLTGDLLRVVNAACVSQSMENIINTYIGERPYSSMGTALQLRLFENSTTIETQLIRNAVSLSLQQYEPRAIILNIQIVVNPNGNSYTLTITWKLINTSQVLTLNVILQRNR